MTQSRFLPRRGGPVSTKTSDSAVYTIRQLCDDENTLWDTLAGEGNFDELRRADLDDSNSTSYFAAEATGTLGGVLRVTHLPGLDLLRDYHEADARVRAAFARHLAQIVAEDLLLHANHDAAALRDEIERTDLMLKGEKVFVEREVAYAALPATELTFASLDQVGELAFVDLLYDAAEGDEFEDRDARPRHEQYMELVDGAGDEWDPQNWFVAMLQNDPVGVVLPQVLPNDGRGTMSYLGVVPAFRQRGFGAVLHGFGLWNLGERGASSYIGSTDVRNVVMRRIFERNDCEVTRRQVFFRQPD